MEKCEKCRFADVSVLGESTWRRFMMKRETNMEGRLEEISAKPCKDYEDVQIKNRCHGIDKGMIER